MSRPNVYEFNLDTQEEVIREMNDVEYQQYLVDLSAAESRAAEKAAAEAQAIAKAEAKAEALAQLGLSQEIINLLAD
jgi:hypothetical protein